MPKINQEGIANILLALFAFIGIGIGIYLVQNPTFFSPRAVNQAANNNSYTAKVLVLNYYPLDSTGQNLDANITGVNQSLSQIRDHVAITTAQGIAQMTNGTKLKGYRDESVQPSITYQVLDTKEYLEALPVSSNRIPWNPSLFRPDYNQILNRENICDWVDNRGVKQVWLWGYHFGNIEPAESNMAMGSSSKSFWNRGDYGDVSNSEQTNDMPVCNKTYTLYNYNYGRGLGELLEDHGHQIEAVFRFVDNSLWEKFQKPNGETNPNVVNHCGWTHSPPNSGDWSGDRGQYDWNDKTIVKSDCEDWKPEGGGQVKDVNCDTWYEPFYKSSFASVPCQNDMGAAFKIWWMQNIPGKANTLIYQGKPLRNWWDFYADFDNALVLGKSLTLDIPSPSPSSAAQGEMVKVYRVLDPSGLRFWTMSVPEVQLLVSNGWINEGGAYYAYSPYATKPSGTVTMYRLKSKSDGTWFWTISEPEVNLLVNTNQTHINEGAAFYVYSPYDSQPLKTEQIYRVYTPDGKRFWTNSIEEVNYLVARGAINEGVAFYTPIP